MLISFVGSPASGKTTLAADLFATLKSMSYACEFITERARYHIAQKRCLLQLKPQDTVMLTEEDQYEIMMDQLEHERVTLYGVTRETPVVSDSSPLNSLLYMSERTRDYERVIQKTQEAIAHTSLVFYCPPILRLPETSEVDYNRIHRHDESLEIDSTIPKVFSTYAPEILKKMIPVVGEFHQRKQMVLSTVMKANWACD